MSSISYDTRQEKKAWLFSPFLWTLCSSVGAIPALVYWYRGDDNPTSTILSLTIIIAVQFGCTLWGISRLRYATR